MIIPWQVDVPQDERPVMNWLIVLACFVVFFVQMTEVAEYAMNVEGPEIERGSQGIGQELGAGRMGTQRPAGLYVAPRRLLPPAREHVVSLDLRQRDLLQHRQPQVSLRLCHAGCRSRNGPSARLSPMRSSGPAAPSTGVVGMYLVMFPTNEITCYYSFYLLYWRQFCVSSYWMILFWLLWDILGAVVFTASGTAYFAHLGGFAAGAGLGVVLCKKGWCLLDKYDRSLVQIWRDRKTHKRDRSFERMVAHLGLDPDDLKSSPPAQDPEPPQPSIPMLDMGEPPLVPESPAAPICVCGCKITVSKQYAGKTVRCPRCKGPVQIPRDFDPHPTQRPSPRKPRANVSKPVPQIIRFSCSCGQKIKIPARYAGRAGRCPGCGTHLRIPSEGRGSH